jgi:hypothetical protein
LFSILKNPANRHRAVGFTKEQTAHGVLQVRWVLTDSSPPLVRS